MDEALLQLGVTPVSPDSPAGGSARYEPEFEALEAEIGKLKSVDAVPVDWGQVVDAGTGILKSKSKDLLVAAYLCNGLYVRDDYAGLATGLTIIRDLVKGFWDTMYPEQKRMRARVTAVKWLVDRLADRLGEDRPGADRRAAVTACLALADEIEKLMDEQLGEQRPTDDQMPNWDGFRRELRGHDDRLAREEARLEEAKAAAQQPPAAAPGTGQENRPAPATASAPQEIASDKDADKALRICKDILRKVAAYRLQQKPADPLPYHLLRMAVWADVAQPVNQDGVTQIMPPPAERLAVFDGLMQAGNYPELIRQVESSFANAPFWLDAHRYVATALEALGHVDAQRVVIDDLGTLLRRFPRLSDCKFAGGRGFADDLTRVWIQASVLVGGANQDESPVSAAADTGLREAGREAKTLAAKGKFKDAVDVLREGRKQAGSGRERFLWDLQQATFWQETGHLEIAVAQLESLDEEAQLHRLEQWEPELSVQIAALLLVCYTNMENNGALTPERVAHKERVQSRLSRLDSARAMDLIKKT